MRWKRAELAGAVYASLDVHPRERVLAWADDGAGRPVVATETALHVQRVPPEYARFGWEQIERASYEAGTLTVVLGESLGGATLRVPVGPERQLPVVVRDRITASVVVDRFVALSGDSGARIIGRRGPDGTVAWQVELDPALDGDAAARAASQVAFDEVRAEVGDL
ncbi:MAG: hypothetical protein LH645_11240 [Actinomycetia bacterium]|nr:hypothetical protein [Actinomycetes bacterium]